MFKMIWGAFLTKLVKSSISGPNGGHDALREVFAVINQCFTAHSDHSRSVSWPKCFFVFLRWYWPVPGGGLVPPWCRYRGAVCFPLGLSNTNKCPAPTSPDSTRLPGSKTSLPQIQSLHYMRIPRNRTGKSGWSVDPDSPIH